MKIIEKIYKLDRRIIVAIIIACCLIFTIFYLYYITRSMICVDDWDYIDMDYERTYDGWEIQFDTLHKAWDEHNTGFNYEELEIVFNGTSSKIMDLNNSYEGQVIFIDNDNNGHANTGDSIIIFDPKHVCTGYNFSVYSMSGHYGITLK